MRSLRETRLRVQRGEAVEVDDVDRLVELSKHAHALAETTVRAGVQVELVRQARLSVDMNAAAITRVMGRVLDALTGRYGVLRPLGAGYVEDLRLWLHGVIGRELEAVEEPRPRPRQSRPPPGADQPARDVPAAPGPAGPEMMLHDLPGDFALDWHVACAACGDDGGHLAQDCPVALATSAGDALSTPISDSRPNRLGVTMRPPVRDPLARRKNVLLRGEQDVIDAADRIARRFRISRNEALNAMLREFINGEPDPALRLARYLQAAAAAAATATVEAIRREVAVTRARAEAPHVTREDGT